MLPSLSDGWCPRWRRACAPSAAALHARTCWTGESRTHCCWRSSRTRGLGRWCCHDRHGHASSCAPVGRRVMARNYGTPSLSLVRGDGCRVWDADGRDYLDLVAGIAVSSLGHAHPAIVDAVSSQVRRIAHTSNLYLNEPAIALAERLVDILGVPGARVFLCNDGTTANEAAIKTARRARPAGPGSSRRSARFTGGPSEHWRSPGRPRAREPFAPSVSMSIRSVRRPSRPRGGRG